MNVLLTGVAGFIASHIAERLLRDGHIVVGVDSFITGNSANITPFSEHERFAFLEADLSLEGDKIERFCAARNIVPNRVLHFASPASPADYARYPLETMAANSHGTEFCAGAALRWGAALLFASTAEIYGDPLEHPQRESYRGNVHSIGPRSCYDEGKRYGEAVVAAYTRHFGLDGRIVRIFNTYGPRMRAEDGRVIPNFVTRAIAGEALRIQGDGAQTRSFCYIDDLVEGIVRFALLDRAPGLVLNMGNPFELSIERLAFIVSETAGVALNTQTAVLPVDDPMRRRPDITQAKELLGWEPSVDIHEGLRRTIAWFREHTCALGSGIST